MKRFVTITAIAVAAAMLGSSAALASGWNMYASHEPSSAKYDTAAYMWQDEPGNAGDRIYFNVYQGIGAGGYPGVSPNSATLGSSIESVNQGFAALFGEWADCNHDGFVGLADGAIREYRAEVSNAAGHPVDTTLCKSIDDKPGNRGKIHYNAITGWVTELIPIANRTVATDYRLITDLNAKVWGDALQPDGMPVAPNSAPSCTVGFAHGQARSTGGILAHADCLDGHRGDRTVNTVNDITHAGLPTPSSLYPNVGLPAVVGPNDASEGTQNSFVSGEQDCSAKPIVAFSDVPGGAGVIGATGGDPTKRGVRAPGTPTVNANGNVAATVNETHEESIADDCNTQNDAGADFWGNVENSGSDSSVTSHKIAADYNFIFRPWNNRQGTGAGGCASSPVCATPADAGLFEVYAYQATGDNYWSSTPVTGSRPDTGTVRVDFEATSATPDLFPAHWYTFYAYTSVSGRQTPTGGNYGSEWCSVIGPGDEKGWDCDPADWNINPDTGAKVPNAQFLGTVNDPYQFRDVDCYDTTVTSGVGARVVAGAADLTDPTHGCA